ncbi:MAG TPA: type II secretion system F family protein [Dermatophilaceae bacterium]|nr:type II secretion system F family protein [Dermatophilaceae bacterium]
MSDMVGGDLLVTLLAAVAIVSWSASDPPARAWSALYGGTVAPTGRPWPWPRRVARGAVQLPWHGSGRGVETEEATADLLAVLDQVATALRAGVSPGAALAALSRTGSVPPRMCDLVDDLVGGAQTGEPLGPTWRSWAVRLPGSGLNLLAQAWVVSEDTGAPLAESVASAVRMVRAERDQHRLVATTLAQARATISVLTVLPLGGPLLAFAVGVDPASMLAAPGPTLVSVAAGVALLVAGRQWVRRLVARTLRGPVVT